MLNWVTRWLVRKISRVRFNPSNRIPQPQTENQETVPQPDPQSVNNNAEEQELPAAQPAANIPAEVSQHAPLPEGEIVAENDPENVPSQVNDTEAVAQSVDQPTIGVDEITESNNLQTINEGEGAEIPDDLDELSRSQDHFQFTHRTRVTAMLVIETPPINQVTGNRCMEASPLSIAHLLPANQQESNPSISDGTNAGGETNVVSPAHQQSEVTPARVVNDQTRKRRLSTEEEGKRPRLSCETVNSNGRVFHLSVLFHIPSISVCL